MRLEGRAVLITGGGTGFGRALALAAARTGAHVAINYSRSAAEAEETVDAALKLGVKAVALRATVADPAQAEHLVHEAERALGPLLALVNNAGVTRGVPFADLEGVTPEDWDAALGVNLVGAWHCARAAALRMRTRGEGAVLNVASDSAVSLSGSSIPYVVSKAGLIALTRCLAKALHPTIRVNAIAPGWMETRWLDANLAQPQLEWIRSGAARVVALSDVATLALELLRNDGITGQVVVIDAGDGLGPAAGPPPTTG
jgi:3-oxoacyl-[acyl-carrier protein] reductase